MSEEETKPIIPTRKVKRAKTWVSTRFLETFSGANMETLLEAGQELIRKRRVLDFYLSPGRVSARVLSEQPKRVEIVFSQLSSDQWQRVFEQLAEESFYLATLLSGEIPEEIEEAFRAADTELFSNDPSEIDLLIDGQSEGELSADFAAVIIRLLERLDNDPFAMFLLRGTGREELLFELRKIRAGLKRTTELRPSLEYQQANYEPAPPLADTLDQFWSLRKDLSGLSYELKADELPASVLKWLDPLPLGGLEEYVEPLLEEAYARVASRAQAYGLGFVTVRPGESEEA